MQTAKLLIRKRYYKYVLFLIPVFIVQVTELVQFIINFENSTDSRASDNGAAGREGRTILGAQAKPLYSQMALSRKPFGIGHMFI